MDDNQFDLGRRPAGPDFVVPEGGAGFAQASQPPRWVIGPPGPAAPAAVPTPAAEPHGGWRIAALGAVCVVAAVATSAGTSYLVTNAVAPQSIQQQLPASLPSPGVPDAQSAAAVVLPSVIVVRAGSSRGSGFSIDDEGHVLTNGHVVEGYSRVEVRTADGRETVARVVGADPATDVAVLELAGTPPPTARLGTSSALRIGQPVIAIGAPLGLSSTVTAGIVSSTDRRALLGPGRAELDMVQTDASINPGNSGGPLANLEGQVVGMNTAIATVGGPESGSIGIGFAVPIDRAVEVARQLIAND